jgi:hypothetical protein
MEAINQLLQSTISKSDIRALKTQYQNQHQMLVIENFLPPEYVVNHLVPQVEGCSKFVHRVKVPGFKKSGSVSYQNIQKHAEDLFNIYRSDVMKNFIEAIVGESLDPCPEKDPHAAALYYYTEPGDRIGVHYDKSFYKGKR